MNRRHTRSPLPALALVAGYCATAAAFAQAPGTLDPAFWSGGVFEVGWGEALRELGARADGSVLAPTADALFQVSAASATQTPDALFGPFGGAMAASAGDGVVTADLVLTHSGQECLHVTRLTSALVPDPTLGGTGEVYGHCLASFGSFYRVTAVAVGAGGDIYVVGAEPTPTPASAKTWPFLAVFSRTGTKQIYLAPVLVGGTTVPDSALTSVLVDHDTPGVETVWVGGYRDAVPYGGTRGSRDWMAARIVPATGALAPGFPSLRTFRWSGGGPIGPWMRLAPAPAGGVYFGGGASTPAGPRLEVVALLANGSTDRSFGSLGSAIYDFAPGEPAYLTDLAAKPGRFGGLYLFGLSVGAGNQQRQAVLALDAYGTRDDHFGGAGDGVGWLEPTPPGFDLLPAVVPGTLEVVDGGLYLGEVFFQTTSPYLFYSRVSRMLR